MRSESIDIQTESPSRNRTSKRPLVILFYPLDVKYSKSASPLGRSMPIDLLAVAGPLDAAGYDVRIVTANMEPYYLDQIIGNAENAVCLGMSVAIGPQIASALSVSREVKKRFPALPIVWGGWFPTMNPEAVIADPSVDIIVRGQGEWTMKELVDRLASDQSLDTVLGISFKRNGEIMVNAARPNEDINNFPPYPFHLFDRGKFFRSIGRADEKGRPVFIYNSSRGCPRRCTFCSSEKAYRRRWSGLKPARVVKELEELAEGYDRVLIRMADANFFMNRKRVREIASLLIEKGLAGTIEWGGAGCVEDLARLDDYDLALIRKGGCRKVAIGVESGSPEVLSLFGKNTDPASSLALSRRLRKHGIQMVLYFIVGVPGEPPDALKKTLDLAADMYRANPAFAVVDTMYFQPLPGTAMATQPAVRTLYREPANLEEWSERGLLSISISSLFSRRYTREVSHFKFYLQMAQIIHRLARRRSPLSLVAGRILWRAAIFRMKHRSPLIAPEYFLHFIKNAVLPKKRREQPAPTQRTPGIHVSETLREAQAKASEQAFTEQSW